MGVLLFKGNLNVLGKKKTTKNKIYYTFNSFFFFLFLTILESWFSFWALVEEIGEGQPKYVKQKPIWILKLNKCGLESP